jgi:hypothetical protein
LTIKLTEADCRNVTWTFQGIDDGYRVYIGHGTHPVTGVEMTVQKREPIIEDALLKLNAERRNNVAGRRWSQGLGSDKGGNLPMIHVGAIPLNKFMAEFAPHIRQGDKDFARWFFNRDENQPFRTREGKL